MAITFDLISNAVVNDGQTASFDVSNIQGVPVSGCPIGKTFYEGGNLEYPFVDADFTTTPTLTAEGWAVDTSLTFETQSATGGLQKIQSELSVTNGGFWDSSADSVRLYIGGSTSIFSFDISGRSTYMLLQPGVGTSFTAFTVSEWIGVEVSCVIDIEIINGFAVGSVTMSGGGVTHVIDVNSPNDISAVTGVLSLAWVNAGVVDGVVWKDTFISGDNLPNNCTGEVADATIEYYRNGVLDYTGNPWSFPVDGNMDGDSIVARVKGEQIGVEGCPIDETFYEGGTVGYPFLLDDFSTEVTIDPEEGYAIIDAVNQNDVYDPYPTGVDETADLSVSVDLRHSTVGYLNSGSFGRFIICGNGANIGVSIDTSGGALRFGISWSGENVYTNYYSEWFGTEVSITLTIYYSGSNVYATAKLSGNGVTDSLITEVYPETNRSVRFAMGRLFGPYLYLTKFYAVGNGFAYNCTGETPVYDFSDSDPVIMSVLHYTVQPPSPQNLTGGDPLSLTWGISGVTGEAVGCPIDQTFYEGGTTEYPFVPEDWMGAPVLDGQELKVVSLTDGYFLTDSPDKISFSLRSEASGYCSLYLTDSGGVELFKLGWMFSPGSLAVAYRVGGVYTTFGTVTDTSGLLIEGSIVFNTGSIDIDAKVSSVAVPTEFFEIKETAIADLSLVRRVACRRSGGQNGWFSLLNIVGTNLPNNCTGLSYPTDYIVNKNGVPVDSGSTTDTTISYSIPSVALGDAGGYDLAITNGGRDPFQSDIVVVNVSSGAPEDFGDHEISFGSGATVPCTITHSISTKLQLAMKKVTLTGGSIQWRDLLRKHDSYSCSFDMVLNPVAAALFEDLLKYPDQMFLTSLVGVHPFSPLFNYAQAPLRVIRTDVTFGGALDTRGNANGYKLKLVPGYRDIYQNLPEFSGSVTPCHQSKSSWALNGIPVPFPEGGFKPIKPDKPTGNPLNGNYSDVDRPFQALNEITRCKVEMDLEAARKLVLEITTVRAGQYSMATPANHSPFGQKYQDNTQFTVILADNTINIEHDRADNFIFDLSFQLKEVVL